MKKINCLNFDQLFRLIRKDKNVNEETIEINEHIQVCQQCQGKLVFLRNLNDALKKKNPKSGATYPARGNHLSDKLMEKYFQGSLSDSKIEYIYHHLACCSDCLQEFNYLVNPEQLEPSEIDSVMARIEAAEVADRLAPYLAYFTKPAPTHYLKQRFAGLKTGWQGLPALLKTGVSFAGAVILAFFLYQGYQSYQFQYAVKQAFLHFRDNHMIKDNQPRPTGGFPYQLFTPKDDNLQKTQKPDYTIILEALQKNPYDARLNHYLGTICFFEGKIHQAEEYYLKALAQDEHNAEIYNDLALIDVDRRDFQKAIEHLERAVQLNSKLLEARYNLAVVWQLRGDEERAVVAWQTYLKLDTDPNSVWHKLAKDRLSELSK
jgi:tetratricopeptide (TPR) repeat protein